jgi:MFS family permease
MNAGAQLPPRAWLIVGLLWFTVLSNYLARTLVTTMHGSLVAAIPMTEAQFGLLMSSLLWTYGLASPFAGFLADRFKRSRVIVASMLLWSVITWLTSYARTFEQLLIVRSSMGLIEACYMPAALALICDYHRGPTRSLATATHHTGYVAGLALSGVGGWVAEQYSWHFAFALVGLVGLAYSLPLGLLLRDVPPPSATPSPGTVRSQRAREALPDAAPPAPRLGQAVLSLLGRGYFVMMLAAHALLNLIGWTVIGWVPVFLQERFHLTQGLAGISATGYTTVASVLGLFLGGLWADRWSRTRGRARMFVPAIGLLIAAPGMLLFANTGVFTVAILGLLVYWLFVQFYDPNTMPVLCEVVDARYRATGYGLLNMVGMISAGFGIYISGVMRDLRIDLHIVFDLGAVVCVICALIYYFINPRGVGRRIGATRLCPPEMRTGSRLQG